MKKRNRLFVFDSALLLVLLLFWFSPTCEAASFSKKAPEPKAKFEDGQLTLKWPALKNVTGYKVYRCNASGEDRKQIRDVRSNSVKLKNVKTGTIYYYQVRGYLEKKSSVKYTDYSKVLKVSTYRRSTLKQFLLTALKPVGSTMYVWGGGWDTADVGAGIDARTIGVSKQWKKFFKKQTGSYNYRNTRYQTRNGLDCSGYVGWCIYNILETENGKPGYVMLAETMTRNFSARGWGSYTAEGRVKNYRAGDIMSTSGGHVWIVIGQCSDGSVVILHSSPPGVQLMGTPTPGGKTNSRAVALAKKYMKKYFPEWYKKFPDCSRGISYLKQYSQMRWDITGNVIMSDPDKYRKKTADQILKDLFKSR